MSGVDLTDRYTVQFHADLASDGEGGAIVAWQDKRSKSNYDIYAQRITNAGGLGSSVPGTVAGTVYSDGTGLANASVTLSGGGVYGSTYSDENGVFEIKAIPPGDYQIRVREYLGYSIDEPGKPVTIESGVVASVDFTLSPMVSSNKSELRAYWGYQFRCYVMDRGYPKETIEDLIHYVDEAYGHYYYVYRHHLLGYTTDIDHWYRMLSPDRTASMHEKAKAQVVALLLNLASLKVGQYTPATVDGKRTVGDVLTYVSELLVDDIEENDKRARNLAAAVNARIPLPPGAVPEGNRLYKGPSDISAWDADVPTKYALFQNYPNPFNPSTTIEFALPHAGFVTLKVFNVLGKEVATLMAGEHAAGTFKATWDASGLPSGVYFYRLTAGEYFQTQKMVLMK
jgi:hypothetical protein